MYSIAMGEAMQRVHELEVNLQEESQFWQTTFSKSLHHIQQQMLQGIAKALQQRDVLDSALKVERAERIRLEEVLKNRDDVIDS